MHTHYVYTQTYQASLSFQNRQNMARPMKWVEMEFSMTGQEPIELVMAIELVIMTGFTTTPSTICPTLTTVEVSFKIKMGAYVLLTRGIHHRCPENLSSTSNSSPVTQTQPAAGCTTANIHAYHQTTIVSQEVRLRFPLMH